MFLMVTGARHGAITGESTDKSHKDEIEVLRWSWGMKAQPALGTGESTGRSSVSDLKIVKRVDRASPSLLNALRTNEPIDKAVLTLRKGGGDPLEYLKITIERGRVTSLTVDAGSVKGESGVIEEVCFSFNKIKIVYTPQGADGRALGGVTYESEWGPS
jgi:type VI secretion system secreted protein Hcp